MEQAASKGSMYDKDSDYDDRYRVFTLDYIFRKVIDYGEDQAEARIRVIAKWKIRSSENILQSLLNNSMDKVAW
jgi:hypothetical protein